MTVLQALQTAAVRLVGRKPSVFFSSTEQLETELVDLVNEAANDIVSYQDWQSLVSVANFTGDGVVTSFDKPEGYDRMMMTSEVQDLANWVWGYHHVPSVNDFLIAQGRQLGTYPGIWCIYDDKFNFYPAPPDGQLASFPYINKNYALGSDGNTKEAFTKDDDQFRIPGGDRLLALWLVWRWRENKKLDATGDQENFVRAIDDMAAKDKGSRIYRSNPSRIRGRFYAAWPGILGP